MHCPLRRPRLSSPRRAHRRWRPAAQRSTAASVHPAAKGTRAGGSTSTADGQNEARRAARGRAKVEKGGGMEGTARGEAHRERAVAEHLVHDHRRGERRLGVGLEAGGPEEEQHLDGSLRREAAVVSKWVEEDARLRRRRCAAMRDAAQGTQSGENKPGSNAQSRTSAGQARQSAREAAFRPSPAKRALKS